MIKKREQFNAFQLAGMAECASPDSRESAGAMFLLSVQANLEEVLADTEETTGDPADLENPDVGMIHEIADAAPAIYTSTRWAEFVDLGAYQEDISELMPEVNEQNGGLEAAAGVALFIIAERLCYALLERWGQESEEEEGE